MKSITKRTLWACVGLLMAGGLAAEGALLVYEGFDTPNANGTDATAADVTGTGFSGYGNTNFRMDIEDGLGYTDASGRNLAVTGRSAGMDVGVSGTQNMQFVLTSTIANSGTIYMSYLLDLSGVTSFGMSAGLQDAQVGDAASPLGVLEATFRSTSSNWGIYSDGNGIDQRTGPTSFPDATGSFFVISELNMDTEVMTTYLNPTDLTDFAGSAAFTISDTATGTWDPMTHFGFSLGSNIAGTIDEIRIGTTLSDVGQLALPEPGSVALVLIGTLIISAVRNKGSLNA